MSQNISSMTAEQAEATLCKRLEAARLAQNISQQELAAQAGISRRTVSRLEAGQGISFNTMIRVMRALDLTQQLETLIPTFEIRPIERVKFKRERKHASSPRPKHPDDANTKTKWTWGDS